MTDQTPKIDTGGIEALRQIKKEQSVLNERLEKMNKMKGKVSDVVFEKVLQDYREKQTDLDSRANPLKDQVRGQYGVLKSLMDDLIQARDKVLLEKEELEFRNELGEFDEAFFEQEKHQIEVSLTEKQAEMDEAEQMKALFVAAFDSEDDLESGLSREPEARIEKSLQPKPEPIPEPEPELEPESEPEVSYMPPPEPQVADDPEALSAVYSYQDPDAPTEELATLEDPGLVSEDILENDPAVESLIEADNALLEDMDALEDVDLPGDLDELDANDLDDDFEDTGDFGPPPLPEDSDIMMAEPGTGFSSDDLTDSSLQPPPLPSGGVPELPIHQVAAGQGGDDPDGTMIISNPKIVSLNNAIEGQVVVLGMGTTSIGRSPDNDIHLTEDRISRKHSQIAFGPGGYALYDLNSENGTYVNGNRIREHFLSDGDIVMVGTYKFLYRDH